MTRSNASSSSVLTMEAHPENVPLFGGVAGAVLGVDEFEICEGLVLRKTYAHVMSPYILAFRRPERPGQHHPAPWKSARGGVWMDVEIEIALHEDCRPTGFDRLNTLWWTLALLRLSSGASLRLPVVSDTSFAAVAELSREPVLWPIETLPRQFLTVPQPPQIVENEHLLWVREAFAPGAALMDDLAFGRAFQTFDRAIWAHSAGSALVTIWAALETLIGPGDHQISKRLTATLAALLEPPGPDRDRLFARLKSLYEARGGSAHASREPEAEQLLSSFDIGRRSFLSCIAKKAIPDADRLHRMWRRKE